MRLGLNSVEYSNLAKRSFWVCSYMYTVIQKKHLAKFIELKILEKENKIVLCTYLYFYKKSSLAFNGVV